MKIGYVVKKYPRLSETFILNEMLELERQGFAITVLSLYKHDEGLFHPGVLELRAPVVYLSNGKERSFMERLYEHGAEVLATGDGLLRGLGQLLQNGAHDVWRQLAWGLGLGLEARARGLERLHAHFATGSAQAAAVAHEAWGLPFSVTCHAKDIYRHAVDPARFRRIAARADGIVTVCDANRRHIEENLLGPDHPTRVHRVYNGIDLDLFSGAERAPATPPLVLGVGRLVPKKGFHHLLGAAARLRERGHDLRVVLVGDGEQRAALEALRDELGLGDVVELAGATPQPRVRELLLEATALALPCTIDADGNRDALPTVLLEALAAGVAVVSTPIAGVPEIVDHGRAGRLVPEEDPTALADALDALLCDPDQLAMLAERGRRRAEELFDLRRNVAQLAGLFEQWSAARGGKP